MIVVTEIRRRATTTYDDNDVVVHDDDDDDAMHFSANAWYWDRMSSVRLSVTLVICDHIGWKSWKLITRTTSPTPSLFVAKRRSA